MRGEEGKPGRESKPSAVSMYLNRLEAEVEELENFLSELTGNISTVKEEQPKLSAALSFTSVYGKIPGVLDQLKDRLQKCREELREMLI